MHFSNSVMAPEVAAGYDEAEAVVLGLEKRAGAHSQFVPSIYSQLATPNVMGGRRRDTGAKREGRQIQPCANIISARFHCHLETQMMHNFQIRQKIIVV